MDSLLNPKISSGNLIAIAGLLLGLGSLASIDRLTTSAAENSAATIAATRVEQCRVVGGGDKLVLGAYYAQPTDGGGQWLSEGTYICDLFGGSGRIERGGYLQFLTTSDAISMNKTLMKRLKDSNNPDNDSNLRPRRDTTQPIYQPPVEQKETGFTGEPQ